MGNNVIRITNMTRHKLYLVTDNSMNDINPLMTHDITLSWNTKYVKLVCKNRLRSGKNNIILSEELDEWLEIQVGIATSLIVDECKDHIQVFLTDPKEWPRTKKSLLGEITNSIYHSQKEHHRKQYFYLS